MSEPKITKKGSDAWERYARSERGQRHEQRDPWLTASRIKVLTGSFLFVDFVFCYGTITSSLVSIFSTAAGDAVYGLGLTVSGAFYDAIWPAIQFGFEVFRQVGSSPNP